MTDEQQSQEDIEETAAILEAEAAKPKPKRKAKGEGLEPTEVHVEVGPGVYDVMKLPDGVSLNERRFSAGGRNYEHIDEDPKTGAWRYRRM